MKNIIIASRGKAIDILSDKRYNAEVTAIVSISDYKSFPPQAVIKAKKDKIVIVLLFDDITEEMLEIESIRKKYHPPTKEDIQKIIDNADEILNSGGKILCHCQAGISRSAAAAFILKCIDLGPGNEEIAAEYIIKNNSLIYPNDLMIKIAQEILGDKWDLITPLNKILKKENI